MKLWMLVTLVVAAAVQAQAPAQDATVMANAVWDSQIGGSYGLKVASTTDRTRVVILKNGVWGMDANNRVRFQLLMDGTLHLFNAEQQETITLDGENGAILVRGQYVKLDDGRPAR